MNARSKAAAVAVTLVVPVLLQGQQRVTEPKVRITVMTFQAPDKTGAAAADQLRDRLQKQWQIKDVYVLPTKDVNSTLENSGYSPDQSLAQSDERSLASLLRADDYVTGVVTKGAGGAYQVDARLVLQRDANLSQGLPSATSPKLGDAMDKVAGSVKDAMRQLESEHNCLTKARASDINGATAEARKAITSYPQNTLVRLCLANVFYSQFQKATSHADSLRFADSVLVVSNQIITADPKSVAALTFNAQLYKVTGDSAKSRAALIDLIRADPSNDRLITQVVNDLAATGHASDAVPLVKELVARSPGDPQMLRTAFLVYYNASDYKDAAAAGPELIQADTAQADSLYYIRMAGIYTNLSRADSTRVDSAIANKSIDILKAGTVKFPTNGTLLLGTASALRKAGRTPEAADFIKRAVAANPNDSRALLLLADTYGQAGMADSVSAVLQRAAALPGADKSTLAILALSQGQQIYKAANTSKNRADFQKAITFFQLSDRINPSIDAKFLTGVSAFSIAQSAANDANTGKSCELAQMASAALGTAGPGLQAGLGSDSYKAPATQYLQYVGQFKAPIDQEVKRFCK